MKALMPFTVVLAVLVAEIALFPVRGNATASRIALADCLGKPVVEPRGIVLACADGGFSIQNIHWTGWGHHSLRAWVREV
jgi:hypothetical protein